jgi:hypothetical protein
MMILQMCMCVHRPLNPFLTCRAIFIKLAVQIIPPVVTVIPFVFYDDIRSY